MNQRMSVRRPQVVESGWLGQVIDQGVELRFGRNRNGAEVGIRAPRAKVRGAMGLRQRSADSGHCNGKREFPAAVFGVWAKWSAEGSWRSAGKAAGKVQR
jgi:hypothetical protein